MVCNYGWRVIDKLAFWSQTVSGACTHANEYIGNWLHVTNLVVLRGMLGKSFVNDSFSFYYVSGGFEDSYAINLVHSIKSLFY